MLHNGWLRSSAIVARALSESRGSSASHQSIAWVLARSTCLACRMSFTGRRLLPIFDQEVSL